uniref:NDT80 domain-containing protein n=1 Tax=Ditylenchus dipsaci TaxID=166011 RepID=A0A915EEW2_9BILA
MYGNGAGVGNGQTRLPDSPPITDISASGSSASPSSGSDSPFSPENYRNYHNINPNNHPNGVLMTMQMPQNNLQNNDPMMTDQLVNQMHHRQQQQQRQILQQQQVSPQSEFLSPYPPSQSTPGSHSQVSPPAISNQRRSCGSSNGCDDCQPISYMQNVAQSYDPRMDMYSTNSANDMGVENIQRQQAGQKRRRMVPDVPAAAGNLPNVKCELNGNSGAKTAGQKFGSQQNGNTRSYPATPLLNKASMIMMSRDCRELLNLHRLCQKLADKGFNYSLQDNCFVNQKKNHFQITASISRNANSEPPYFVRLPNGELQPISEFMLAFCGVKHEMPSSEIQIRQSQTDRKPVPHEAVRFPVDHSMRTKQTKRRQAEPEQRFFLLVVKLLVNTPIGPVLVQAYQSDRVIVRASNPGQFTEPESDVSWQRANGNVLTFSGQVAIGTDKPIQDAQLTVLGNVVTSGQITRPLTVVSRKTLLTWIPEMP